MENPLEFLILGPLEVRSGVNAVHVGSSKQRALLGTLLMHPNETVSTARLVDGIWGERPPATAEKLVQGYVHALRKQLGDGVLETRAPGYRLKVDSGALDLAEFERLVEQARLAPLPQAVELRRRALALWRGSPLADVTLEGPDRNELARLGELRFSTQIDQVDAELALGRHAKLVGELEALTAAHPYQERLAAQLMLALYRSGRQAEALEVYRTVRAKLDDELGLQPGQELRDLEAAILRQDDALEVPVRVEVPRALEDAAADTEGTIPVTGGKPRRRAVLRGGAILAGYRIEALIGRGGMGAVYRADEEGLGRKVALKVIAPELAQDEGFRERFLRESRIAASLDHSHVIPVYQAGEEDGVLFLAMRYVEGHDLAKLVAEEGLLEPRRVVELLSQVADALDAAHEQGLVHRDVKPSNILIAEAAGKEHCYLGDFGLTKRTGSLSGVSGAGEMVGTLEYVAPEQIAGDRLDEHADVYSLGCVLYECLTGQPPFPRATDVALLWAHVHEEPTPPSQARPDLPKELDTVMARALAKEPGRRYRSAGELVTATRSALGLAEGAAPAKRVSRRLLAGAATLVLVGIAAALAFVLTRDAGGLTAISPNSVGVIDPETNKLVAEVTVGIRPGPVTSGLGSIWVGNLDGRSLTRIDQATREVVDTIPLPATPDAIAVGGGAVWVVNGRLGTLYRVDPEFRNVSEPIVLAGRSVNYPTGGVDVARGSVWAVFGDSTLAWVDIGTLEVGTGVAGVGPAAVVVAGGSVWVSNSGDATVQRFSPLTIEEGSIRDFPVGRRPTGLAAGDDAIWIASTDDDYVTRLDAAAVGSNSARPIPVGDGPTAVAFGRGAVWVANTAEGTVSRIDPETNEVDETIPVGNPTWGLAVAGGSVWVAVQAP